MSEICKNCQGEIIMTFCGHCGQKKAKRIDAKYIKDELQYVLVHTNKGFFYSAKKIIKAPGRTAHEFIDGSRVNHYKPILMVFLLAGISAFITNTFIHPIEIYQQFNTLHGIKDPMNTNGFSALMMKYQSLFMLTSLPFIAIFSWLAFRKWGFNYWENIVANAYLLSAMIIFSIILVIPLQFFLRDSPNLFVIVPTTLSYLSMLGLSFWFFIGLYPEKNVGPVILRVLLMFFLLIVTVIVISIVWGILFFAMNPDKLQHG
jgi:hypothetical protein